MARKTVKGGGDEGTRKDRKGEGGKQKEKAKSVRKSRRREERSSRLAETRGGKDGGRRRWGGC